MPDYGWWGEAHYDYEPPEETYADPNDSYDPIIEHGETVFLDGHLWNVFVRVYDDHSVDIEHSPVYYSCWDGKLPF